MCSVCAEPALLLVCVNLDNQFVGVAHDSGRFAVNLLASRHRDLALRFAGLTPEGALAPLDTDRFAQGDWHAPAGGPPLLDDALVSLSCTLESSVERGTHRVFFGLVTAVASRSGAPLVYADRQFSTTAPLDLS